MASHHVDTQTVAHSVAQVQAAVDGDGRYPLNKVIGLTLRTPEKYSIDYAKRKLRRNTRSWLRLS